MARPDPYFWMYAVEEPEVLAHLAAERAWYDLSCAHLSSLVGTVRAEMFARIPAVDSSVSWRRMRFSYYTRHPTGSDYAQLLRESHTKSGHDAAYSSQNTAVDDENRGAELLLDFTVLAGDGAYLDLGLTLVSPDENLLAYSVDTAGNEVFTLRFRDLRTGRYLDQAVARSYYGGAWSADSTCFFYTVHDEAYRPYQVVRHRIGTPVTQDVVVLTEDDERFELNLRASRSGDLVIVWSESRDTGETWVVDAHAPESVPLSVGGRRRGVMYGCEHTRADGGRLLVTTNDDAVEFRLMSAPVPLAADQTSATWVEVRPENPSERLERADAFASHVVLSYRSEGQHLLRVVPYDDLAGTGHVLASRFPCGAVWMGRNERYDSDAVTIVDQSYVEPPVWSDVDLATGASTERHRQAAPGHDPTAYVCERRSIPAPDGTPVPVTLVRRRDTPLDGTAPAVLYGYGAYEYTFEPEWSPSLPSLLDRGVVFAHGHVRGGGEGGRGWWLDGRLERKQNTFTDFCAVADGLDGIVDGTRIVARGLSAGGLLMGAVFSQRPERWAGVAAEVPFVDVVTTMFDAGTPLTAGEWDEWGDPRRREEFDWMLAYSPYDNLPAPGTRPDLLVTGAVHDPRVMVREPAKWVAALRATDPDWSPRCVFRCELGPGAHVGPSGRFGQLDYQAEVAAWILDHVGRTPLVEPVETTSPVA